MKFELNLYSPLRAGSLILGLFSIIIIAAYYSQSILLALSLMGAFSTFVYKHFYRLVCYRRTVILEEEYFQVVETYTKVRYDNLQWFRIENARLNSRLVLGVQGEENISFTFRNDTREYLRFRNALFRKIIARNSHTRNFNQFGWPKLAGILVLGLLILAPVFIFYYQAWKAFISYAMFIGVATPFLLDVFVRGNKPLEYSIEEVSDETEIKSQKPKIQT